MSGKSGNCIISPRPDMIFGGLPLPDRTPISHMTTTIVLDAERFVLSTETPAKQ